MDEKLKTRFISTTLQVAIEIGIIIMASHWFDWKLGLLFFLMMFVRNLEISGRDLK
jgi:hypothetical protein